ncbi:solute carrier family 23 protein [Marilutibacter spongiae]|uniref:Xanthine/uracil/vitamin C permease n=1 Tax=Marilutibacter spongiae TaxID=2025720 RepID=A0A7W3TPJ6_9GAMM|nr:solute carrier family 23 protein [Lysobacter spongiae]MBB1062120.1 hypothetical protein [Lysobacter spongiae]
MKQARQGATAAGWRWGPFTCRIPFLHSRLLWPEFLQGTLVATATGLALVPVLSGYFGMSFEQAVACVLFNSIFLVSSLYIFGEPYAPGWTTAALPLALVYVIAGYPDPTTRFQAMTALTLSYAALVFVLGVTGLGRKLMRWLPDTLKAGILLGAALSAFRRVFVDDGGKLLMSQPVTTAVACAICLVCVFSTPFRRLVERHRALALLVALGLLPGFLAAAIIGPLVGEVQYDIQWGWLLPPMGEAMAKMSPFSIGWPPPEMYLAGIPLVLVTYVIQFGDWVTGNEVLREAAPSRPDDPVDINASRSHLALAIRNAASALVSPFFTTQGSLWTGVHVIVVKRWKEGPRAVPDLHSGMMSYYLMGLPFIYFMLPLLTAMKPLLGIALSLTLVLTGFACAYIGMAIPRDASARGAAMLTGAALALLQPWVGLLVGIGVCLLLVGPERRASPAAPAPGADAES